MAWRKRDAVNCIASHLEHSNHRLVFFIGDDRTDEYAFASLPTGVTIKVGRGLPTRASFELADPAAVEVYLWWLCEKLSSRESAG